MTLRNAKWGCPALPDVPPEAVAAPDLARQIRQWQAWLKNERRYSSHTLAAYRRDLWAFLNFLARHNGTLPPLETLRQFGRPDLDGGWSILAFRARARS